ncbi:Stk1 family PASTA domain-containing Ser/Thr kinase [Desulfolucanica intricata]|uniref:Stk1 family PASTA domain-containing Ser/Thr kinase n=1 Tax=Desulfolucanica intricata TaxID=1285191 RepID=UPI00083754C7|nr:Stk1 family PASTA domain-containing Ser/Thr kinase [Desulfolucanica intricata]
MIGKRLGNRFEIIEQLGGGGMAVVYKGKDSYLNRLVTIKVLRPEFASDEEFVRSFRREAQAVASLSHPNIVNIHDVGQEGDIQYLVMEYVEGDNLKNVIKNKRILLPAEAVQLAVQVCDALEHAHENNIIHRDVKPHNILITNTGKAILTDFGIARETTAATLTQTDSIVGSVHYLSPEQAQGEEAGRKSDIYSLGIVMYEMLTGTLPFTGDTPVSVALKHIKDEPVPLKDINPDVPRELQEVVLRAMSKDPNQRQQSAGELARQLIAVKLTVNGGEEDLDATRVIPAEDFKTKLIPAVKPEDKTSVKDTNRKLTPKKDHKNMRPLTWLAAAIILIGLTVGGAMALHNFLNVPDFKVPDLTGRNYIDAKSYLEENGLKVKKEEKYSDKPKGTVIDQSIGPNDPAVPMHQGRVITLTVSKGQEMISIPNLIGKTKQDADNLLRNKGLILVEGSPVFSDEIMKGSIAEQRPGAGEKVPKGSEITVSVSKGRELITHRMPDLAGKTLQEAETLLAQLNLKISSEINYEESEQFLEGYIMAQTPQQGSQVQEGSVVSVTISKGPGPLPRDADVEIDVTDDGAEHIVKIEVVDFRGTTTPYVATHSPGEKVVKTVRYYGQATIRVYLDNEIVYEKTMD